MKEHLFACPEDLDSRGLTNHVLVITRFRVTESDCERLQGLVNLLEEALGTRLPADYRALRGRYAALELGEFLAVGHPGVAGAAVEAARSTVGLLDNRWPFSDPDVDYFLIYDDEGQTKEAPPLTAYPAPVGLLAWGSTENADMCCWVTGPDPDTWHVAVGRGIQWWFFEGGMLDFLAGFLSRTIRCPLISDDFPEEVTSSNTAPKTSSDMTLFSIHGEQPVAAGGLAGVESEWGLVDFPGSRARHDVRRIPGI